MKTKTTHKMESKELGRGNTKTRPNQCKKWCFTYNNYDTKVFNELKDTFMKKGIKFIIGEEIGANGTPHLQGYIECPKKMRWSEITNNKKIHWEVAKGTRMDNIRYCSKDGIVWNNGLVVNCITKLYPWQNQIKELLNIQPDGRKIHWYFDEIGGCGKSSFCKYMYIHHRVPTIQGGKYSDIINIIFNLNMDEVRILLIDIPRVNKDKISYAAIECILNGMITNTKYETGIKVFNPPHVVVFANHRPNLSKLSEDRWVINDLGMPPDKN